MKNVEKEILTYTSPSKSHVITCVVMFIIAPPLFYHIVPFFYSGKQMQIIGAVSAAMAALILLLVNLYYIVIVKSKLNRAVLNGDDHIFSDFENGKHYLNDRLICGEYYLYGKGIGSLVAFSEIAEVYRENNSIDGIQTNGFICAKLKNGKRARLCVIDIRKDTSAEVGSTLREILNRIPENANRMINVVGN